MYDVYISEKEKSEKKCQKIIDFYYVFHSSLDASFAKIRKNWSEIK